MEFIIVAAALYVVGFPVAMFGVSQMHKKLVIERAMEKAQTKGSRKPIPEQLMPKWKRALSFSFKDTRPSKLGTTNKNVIVAFWVLGLIITLVGTLLSAWPLVGVGMCIPWGAIIFSMKTAQPVIDERNKIINKMIATARILGYGAEEAQNPSEYVQIKEWRDLVKPAEIVFRIPPTFSSSSEESFLRLFNQNFGAVTSFVAHVDVSSKDSKEHVLGWDYDKGILTLRAVPPLPTMAPWHERYFEDPAVAWSFFPIALGVENGLEIPNEETGLTENVLGFDLSGEQGSLAKKHGRALSEKIVTSPMVLVAGGTGGGKAQWVQENIFVSSRKEKE